MTPGNGQVGGLARAGNGGPHLVQVAHGFNVDAVRAAFGQGGGLLGKVGHGGIKGEFAHRLHQLAGWPHRAEDQFVVAGHVAGQFRGGHVDVVNQVRRLFQLQPCPCAAEAVG